MSQKLTQLVLLFDQLEVWDTQGRRSISANSFISTTDQQPDSDDGTVETLLSRTINQFHELTTQIRELSENDLSDEVLTFLIDRLRHSNLAVRLQAVEALGYTRNPVAIVALTNTMRHDLDYGVKATAAQSLGIIGNTMATPALVEILQRDILQAGDIKIHWACAQALSFISDPAAIDVLIEIFIRDFGKFEERASDIREATRDALVSVSGEIVVDRLIDLWGRPNLHPINHIDESIRHEMITAFSQIEHPKALDFLLSLANHENSIIREAVMSAFSYSQDARVIKALTHALTDPDSYVRDAAEFSLQRLGK